MISSPLGGEACGGIPVVELVERFRDTLDKIAFCGVCLVVAIVESHGTQSADGGEIARADRDVQELGIFAVEKQPSGEFVSEGSVEANLAGNASAGIGVEHFATAEDRGDKIRIRRVDARLDERGAQPVGKLVGS